MVALFVAACKAIVDELSYEVKKVDPKKTIQVCCLGIYAYSMYVCMCMYSDWKFPSRFKWEAVCKIKKVH